MNEPCTDQRIVQLVLNMQGGARSKRTQCPECCRPDNSALVSRREGQGWVHCFRCGYSAPVPLPALSLGQLRARQEALQAPQTAFGLPRDITPTLPAPALVWVALAGLSEHDVAGRLYWSPRMHSAVLPVHWGGELDAVFMRPLPRAKGQSKYVAWFRDGNSTLYLPAKPEPNKPLWVVEDALSAIRLSKLGVPVCASLGTFCNDTILARVLAIGPSAVNLWLDGDRAGKTGVERFKKKLHGLCGIPTRSVSVPGRDPKHLHNAELTEKLKEGYA